MFLRAQERERPEHGERRQGRDAKRETHALSERDTCLITHAHHCPLPTLSSLTFDFATPPSPNPCSQVLAGLEARHVQAVDEMILGYWVQEMEACHSHMLYDALVEP